MKKPFWIPLLFLLPLALAWQCFDVYSELQYERGRRAQLELKTRLARDESMQSQKSQKLETDRLQAEQNLRLLRSDLDSTWKQDVTEGLRAIKALRATQPPRKTKPREPQPRSGEFFAELMDDPTYVALIKPNLRERCLAEYGKLLQSISADKREALLSLMVEKQLLPYEIQNAQLKNQVQSDDRQSSITNRFAMQKTEGAQIDKEIEACAGPELWAQLQAFKKASEKAAVEAGNGVTIAAFVNNRLSYTDNPLSQEQAEAICSLYNQWYNQVQPEARRGFTTSHFANETLINRCSTVLNPQQMEGLRELQAESQAAAKRRALPLNAE